jgi:Na+/melibiose symporter-like transporter
MLAAVGFNSAAIAAGEVIPDGVKAVLRNINTTYPMIVALVAGLMVLFFMPLNDKRAEQIRKELAEREAQATM